MAPCVKGRRSTYNTSYNNLLRFWLFGIICGNALVLQVVGAAVSYCFWQLVTFSLLRLWEQEVPSSNLGAPTSLYLPSSSLGLANPLCRTNTQRPRNPLKGEKLEKRLQRVYNTFSEPQYVVAPGGALAKCMSCANRGAR
jgi:hypothetical protein